MLDMWTDVFASPGWRTTGTAAQEFAVVPPGWSGPLPAGATKLQAPTSWVWVIGRIKTDGPADYDAVHTLQAGLKLTPLDANGKPLVPAAFVPDPSIDMKTAPKIQVDTMTAAQFFGHAAEVLKQQQPHLTDQPILAQLAELGFEPGMSFDLAGADPVVRQALETVPADAQRLMAWKTKSLARVVNGWSMNTDTMGVYGNYYLKRAIITQVGLGANLPEDAIYPLNPYDDSGQPLDGHNAYTLHFTKADLPPAEARGAAVQFPPRTRRSGWGCELASGRAKVRLRPNCCGTGVNRVGRVLWRVHGHAGDAPHLDRSRDTGRPGRCDHQGHARGRRDWAGSRAAGNPPGRQDRQARQQVGPDPCGRRARRRRPRRRQIPLRVRAAVVRRSRP
jgi:hypothetical protein